MTATTYDDVVYMLKLTNGFKDKPDTCKDCTFFSRDMSTDNFGPGDMCIRNLDINFRVNNGSTCNKFVLKEKKK